MYIASKKMDHSFISNLVFFLFLTHNLHDCTSVMPGNKSFPIFFMFSLKNIGELLWNEAANTTEKSYLQKRLLSSDESILEYDGSVIKSNIEARFTDPCERKRAEDNYRIVDEYISKIELFYENMKKYYEFFVTHAFNGSDIRTIMLYNRMKSEAEANLSDDINRPIELMGSIYRLVVAGDKYSIIKNLQYIFHDYINTCLKENGMNSAQEYIIDFLMHIAAAETKVFMTVQIASEIKKKFTRGDRLHNLRETHQDETLKLGWTNERLYRMHDVIMTKYVKLMEAAYREVWRCDPSSHMEDITYTKLNNVFNIFIAREEDLAEHRGCDDTCSTLRALRSWEPCSDTVLGADCPGTLWGCKPGFGLDTDQELKICSMAPNSTRRYEYVDVSGISDSNVKTHYGPRKNCDNGRIETKYPVNKWIFKCDICQCTSDNNVRKYNVTNSRHTERFFYAQPVYADVNSDYVMTGVRFVKKNGIVFFEIQQGKMSTPKSIEPSSVSWKTIKQGNLYNPSNLIKIEWLHRSIELQDIDVPYGHVLVGLQLYNISDRISLKVISLPIDFVNHKVRFANGYSMYNMIVSTPSTFSKSGLDLEDHDLPDPKVKSNQVVTNKYLKFSTSSLLNDVGQTTIPLLDTQNVTSPKPTPMSGAGLYFKYTGKYAGYIGIKLRTNYSKLY